MLSEKTKSRLFKLAFQYKKTKLWERLADSQLFGVRLADGQTGYCCVMGASQQHVALAVYIGQPGISSLFDAIRSQMYDPEDEEFSILLGYGQDCVQCIFDDDEYVSEEQVAEAAEYAQKLGVTLRAPFVYPHFDRFVPMERPVPIDDEATAEVMITGLLTAIHVAKSLRARPKPDERPFRIPFSHAPGDCLPIFERTGAGKFSISTGVLPDYLPPSIPAPDPVDEFTAARMKKLARDKIWDCTFTFLAGVAIEEDPSCMPAMPFAMNAATGKLISVASAGHYVRDLNRIYRDFVDGVIQNGRRPSKIRVHECDKWGQAFFSVFARQLGIPLTIEKHLPELNDTLANFFSMSMDESDDTVLETLGYICSLVDEMSFKELCQLPYEGRILVAGLLECGHPSLTPEIRNKARRALDYWGMS